MLTGVELSQPCTQQSRTGKENLQMTMTDNFKCSPEKPENQHMNKIKPRFAFFLPFKKRLIQKIIKKERTI
jgi:hypothetical protein